MIHRHIRVYHRQVTDLSETTLKLHFALFISYFRVFNEALCNETKKKQNKYLRNICTRLLTTKTQRIYIIRFTHKYFRIVQCQRLNRLVNVNIHFFWIIYDSTSYKN